MKAVADTSVVISLLTSEQERRELLLALENYELVCVASVEAEIGNAVSAMFRRGRISLAQGMDIIAGFRSARFRILSLNLPRAVEISHSLGIYAYDAYVLECAERLNAPLVTLDRGMKLAAKRLNLTLIEV